jgi:hypothetical protein
VSAAALHPIVSPWAAGVASQYPKPIERRIVKELERQFKSAKGQHVQRWHSAHQWLNAVTDGYEKNRVRGLKLNSNDSEICEVAADAAANCGRIRHRFSLAGLSIQFAELVKQCERARIKPPELNQLERAVLYFGTAEAKERHIKPKVERMADSRWWRRRIRNKHTRTSERLARQLGMVRKQERAYVSSVGMKIVRQRKAANDETLSKMEVENVETGQTMLVSEVALTGVGNPDVRYDEMMTRVWGIQETAKADKLGGRFVTLTAPSRFHSHYKTSGQRIEGHSGQTPRHAQRWLSGVWARVRSQMMRDGVELAGFRVAEPHHDACPHWHMTLFFKSEISAAYFESVLIEKAREAGDGKEEDQARTDFKTIDLVKYPEGVVGYLVKYMTKNLSNKNVKEPGQLGFDYETDEAFEDGVDRVRAWASVWGLRQFQFIGGPSVEVWRELRRIKEPLEDARMEAARRACGIQEIGLDAKDRQYPPDWMQYAYLQGGIFGSHNTQLIKTMKDETLSVYGEVSQKVVGVRIGSYTVTTREKWIVRQVPRERQELMTLEEGENNVNRVTHEVLEAMAKASALLSAKPESAANAGTWTCVNNYTDGLKPEKTANHPEGKKPGGIRPDSRFWGVRRE